MAEGYLSEIRTFSFGFAPRNWAQCNGQLLPINQNQALFALLGTTYGGNGQTTFGLPNLVGKVAVHMGTAPGGLAYTWGQTGGEANHTLAVAEIPVHTHQAYGSSNGPAANTPANNFWASNTGSQPYGSGTPATPMYANALGNAGNGQGHNNMPPFLVLNQCICISGVFPSRN